MKLVKCDKVKGHFYDADKYTGCPHCGVGVQIEKKSVVAVVNESFEQPPAAAPADIGEGTVMMDQYSVKQGASASVFDSSELEVTADFFEDYKTEELLPVEAPMSTASKQRCELALESKNNRNFSYELRHGENMIGIGSSGCNVNIDASEGTSEGAQASIVCSPNGNATITPLAGGRVYLNDYYLMTAYPVKSGDKLTIGGASCVFFCYRDNNSRF